MTVMNKQNIIKNRFTLLYFYNLLENTDIKITNMMDYSYCPQQEEVESIQFQNEQEQHFPQIVSHVSIVIDNQSINYCLYNQNYKIL